MTQHRGAKHQSLTIWRDSCAYWRSMEAPHEIRLPISNDESLASVISRIVATQLLATFWWEATWIVESGSRPLAVVAQQWPIARLLLGPGFGVTSLLNGNTMSPQLQILVSGRPDHVFECLHMGKPLPNKYG